MLDFSFSEDQELFRALAERDTFIQFCRRHYEIMKLIVARELLGREHIAHSRKRN